MRLGDGRTLSPHEVSLPAVPEDRVWPTLFQLPVTETDGKIPRVLLNDELTIIFASYGRSKN
jgi:hypothetical protein